MSVLFQKLLEVVSPAMVGSAFSHALSHTTGELKKSSASPSIIAYGPKGGKIVGYDAHHKPIYAGTQKHNELVAHASTAQPGENKFAQVQDWLGDLHIATTHAAHAGSVLVGKNNFQKLAEAFGVVGVPVGSSVAVPIAMLLPHLGKPLVPASKHLVVTAAAMASGTFGTDAPFSEEDIKGLKVKGELAGSHGGHILESGKKKFAFKDYGGQVWVSRAEEAFFRMGQLVAPDLFPKAEVVEHGGSPGVLISWVDGENLGVETGVHTVEDEKFQKHFDEIVQHQVMDWLMSNHDAHGANFKIDGSGKLVGIDKGQAFKFILSDKLDPTYKPNNSAPIYRQFWKLYKDGKIKGDVVAAAKKVFARLATVSIEQYEQIVEPYWTSLVGHEPPAIVAKKRNVSLGRFKNCRSQWEKFLSAQLGKAVSLDPAEPDAPPQPVQTGALPASVAPAAVAQKPGWPVKVAGVTVHHPGEPAPPGVAWPGKYPGPGFHAEFSYKGKPYEVKWYVHEGKFAGKLKLPSGVEYPVSSPQHTADVALLFEKGKPLDSNSTKIKEWGLTYQISKLLKLKDLEEHLKGSTSVPEPTVAEKDVATLEKEAVVTPEKKTLSLHEQLLQQPKGLVFDTALMPSKMLQFLDTQEGAFPDGYHVWHWSTPEAGTFFAVLDINGKTDHTWLLSSDGELDGPFKPEGIKPEVLAAMVTDQDIQMLKDAAGKWGTSNIAHQTPVSVEFSVPESDKPSTLTVVPPVAQTVPPVVSVDPNVTVHAAVAPATPGMPLSVGSTITKTFQKQPLAKLGTVGLKSLDDGTFEVSISLGGMAAAGVLSPPGELDEATLFYKTKHKSLSAASDHVWLIANGYASAAEYKTKNDTNKIPSGGGWKFWGLNVGAPLPAPMPVQVVPPPFSADSYGILVQDATAAKLNGIPEDSIFLQLKSSGFTNEEKLKALAKTKQGSTIHSGDHPGHSAKLVTNIGPLGWELHAPGYHLGNASLAEVFDFLVDGIKPTDIKTETKPPFQNVPVLPVSKKKLWEGVNTFVTSGQLAELPPGTLVHSGGLQYKKGDTGYWFSSGSAAGLGQSNVLVAFEKSGGAKIIYQPGVPGWSAPMPATVEMLLDLPAGSVVVPKVPPGQKAEPLTKGELGKWSPYPPAPYQTYSCELPEAYNLAQTAKQAAPDPPPGPVPVAPTIPAQPSIALQPGPKFAVSASELPVGAQEADYWYNKNPGQEVQDGYLHATMEKSPGWPGWVPPPGLSILGALSGGTPVSAVVNTHGYVELPGGKVIPTSAVSWTVTIGSKSFPGMSSTDADVALQKALTNAVFTSGHSIVGNTVEQVFPNVMNGAFPANKTKKQFLQELGKFPVATSVVTPTQDIPEPEKKKGVVTKADLETLVSSTSVATKYGKITIGKPSQQLLKKNGFPQGTIYLNLFLPQGGTAVPAVMLKAFLDDHGLGTHALAAPKTSFQEWKAYVPLSPSVFGQQVVALTTAEEAKESAAVPEPKVTVPEPPPVFPPKVQNPADLHSAMAVWPIGTAVSVNGSVWLKGQLGWLSIKDGKIVGEPVALASILASTEFPAVVKNVGYHQVAFPKPPSYADIEQAAIGTTVWKLDGTPIVFTGDDTWVDQATKEGHPGWHVWQLGITHVPPEAQGIPKPPSESELQAAPLGSKLVMSVKGPGFEGAGVHAGTKTASGWVWNNNAVHSDAAVTGIISEVKPQPNGMYAEWKLETPTTKEVAAHEVVGAPGDAHQLTSPLHLGMNSSYLPGHEFWWGGAPGDPEKSHAVKLDTGFWKVDGVSEAQSFGAVKLPMATALNAGKDVFEKQPPGPIEWPPGMKFVKAAGTTANLDIAMKAPPGTVVTFGNGTQFQKMSASTWATTNPEGVFDIAQGTFQNSSLAANVQHVKGKAVITLPGQAPALPKPVKKAKPQKATAEQLAVIQAKTKEAAEKAEKQAKAWKEFQAWKKDNPVASSPFLTLLISHAQAAAGLKGSWYAHTDKDGHLLVGAGDDSGKFDETVAVAKIGEVDSPLGKLSVLDVAKLGELFPGGTTVKGPDGKQHPHGTTFEEKTKVIKTKKAHLAENGVAVSDNPKDPDSYAFKIPGTGEEYTAKLKGLLTEVGLGFVKPFPGQTNTIAILKGKALADAAHETEKEWVALVPPQPDPFVPKPAPFTVGSSPQGMAAPDNTADLDLLSQVTPTEWGHAVMCGGGKQLFNPFLKLKKVKDATGADVIEVHGELLSYDESKDLLKSGKYQLSCTDEKDQFQKELGGVHHQKVGHTTKEFGGRVGTLSSGTVVQVCTSEAYYAHRNQFVVRVPADQNLRACLAEAFTVMGKDPQEMLQPITEEAKELWKKANLVRSHRGASAFWDDGQSGRERYADMEWLDKEVKERGLQMSVAAAQIVSGGGGIPRVVTDDFSADKVEQAGGKFIYSGTDLYAGIVHHLAHGQGVPNRAQGYWNGTNNGGASPGEDDERGGAYGVMSRLYGPGGCGSGGVGATKTYKVIFHPRILNRADHYMYRSDSYGGLYGHFLKKAIGRDDILKEMKDNADVMGDLNPLSDNEILFQHGVDRKDIAGVACTSTEAREKMLNALKEKGVAEVNGIPIEKFCFVAKSLTSVKNACHGLEHGVLP